MKKYLGIDYGRKRVGVASGSVFPKGLCVIENEGNVVELAKKIANLANDEEAEGIVFGLPSGHGEEPHEMTEEIKELSGEVLKNFQTEIFFEAEDLTSVMAEDELKARKVDFRHHKEEVDILAAVLILEHFLAQRHGV